MQECFVLELNADNQLIQIVSSPYSITEPCATTLGEFLQLFDALGQVVMQMVDEVPIFGLSAQVVTPAIGNLMSQPSKIAEPGVKSASHLDLPQTPLVSDQRQTVKWPVWIAGRGQSFNVSAEAGERFVAKDLLMYFGVYCQALNFHLQRLGASTCVAFQLPYLINCSANEVAAAEDYAVPESRTLH